MPAEPPAKPLHPDDPAVDLDQRVAFLREIDRLKTVIRQSPLLDRSRRENSAEHSWHLAMYALVLQDCAGDGVDPARVIGMLLIHDIVEIDVGDMPIHLSTPASLQGELEDKAAIRLFGMLPDAQGRELLALWREFEAGETADAKFAKALDRAQPLIANVAAGGGTWTENGVTLGQVLQRYGPAIEKGSPALWAACERMARAHFGEQPGPG